MYDDVAPLYRSSVSLSRDPRHSDELRNDSTDVPLVHRATVNCNDDCSASVRQSDKRHHRHHHHQRHHHHLFVH